MAQSIGTSHAGSLRRPDDLIELNRRRIEGRGRRRGRLRPGAARRDGRRRPPPSTRPRRTGRGAPPRPPSRATRSCSGATGSGFPARTSIPEHPQLVADRFGRFVDAVGAERVIAATDCGLGGRVHPEIAWAKLEALAQGARLASERLGVAG